MIGIGFIHEVYAFLSPNIRASTMSVLARGGVDSKSTQDVSAYFFHASGFLMLTCGHVMKVYIRKAKKSLPKEIGYSLGASALTCALLLPKSGFWLLVGLGSYIVANAEE